MSIRTKLLILFVAVLVSLFVFSLIASPFLCLLKVDKEASYDTIESYFAECDADPSRILHTDHKASEFTFLSPYCFNSRLW